MKLEYKKDDRGQEGLYSVDGKHQVMMEWEREYMYACIDKLQPSGDVLEIGFGMGYSADRIQSFNVKTHTIIECNPIVLEKLEEYKKTHPNIIIVKGRWQDMLQTCGKFDSIFFDDYIVEDKYDNIRFVNFLTEVLNNHSKNNTKISVYSTNKCNNLNHIENINIESDEYKIDIPEHCNYAKGDKMYTILITKSNKLDNRLLDMINNPFNPMKNYELALEYDKINQTAIALSYYLRCAEFTEDPVLASECLLKASFCINRQGGRDEKELYLIKQAISVSPTSIEPYYIASLYFTWRSSNKTEQRYWLDAYLYANIGITILENNNQSKEFINPVGYNKSNIYYQKAFAALNIGKLDEAREIYVKILSTFELPIDAKNFVIDKLNQLPSPNHSLILYSNNNQKNLRFVFNDNDKIEKNYSQMYQDMFVLSMHDGKSNGTYLEIGSGDYKNGNNTYLLETIFDWKGVSIDLNTDLTNNFNNNRKNICICNDATKIDYFELLSNNFDCSNIDYLQLDCDPPNITFDILNKIPFNKYKFGVITYEHDFYNDITGSYREKSRKLLKEKGYKLICGNISCYQNKYPFEDWWIHPDIINETIYKLFEREDDTPINGEKYMLTSKYWV